ncbi:MAG: glutamine--fructose-6-phosphate transaminase (isomerizing) [Oligoflexia bacterium]|nr:glutamine--fructose-6-phosphate transaminase (isomerizing) [Oligoflexia bacterium]
MCGIVGYLGNANRNGVDVILEGLTRLEYRGYDSAGICFRNEKSELLTIKSVGKVQNLKSLLELNKNRPISNMAIGHTRWATHGEVAEKNAHPHVNGKLAIVHNGIIENLYELKSYLQAEGVQFSSDTDSEVFLHLTYKFFNSGASLKDAVIEAFKLIKGNSAFLVIAHDLQEMIAIKRVAPLVIGRNSYQSEVFVSSDPFALIGYADQLLFPEDEVVAVLTLEEEPQFFELNGAASKRFSTQNQQMHYSDLGKGSYEHFMQKEIFEQPLLIKNWIHHYLEGQGKKSVEELTKLLSIRPEKIGRIHLVACGTAWHAALLIGDMIERTSRIPTNVQLASEFRYKNPILHANDIAIFISQSGETADTLAAQELCKRADLFTLAIVNVANSTLYRNSHFNLLTHAGIEVGVASTKAFTLQVLTGYLFSKILKEREGFDRNQFKHNVYELLQNMERGLDRAGEIAAIASELYSKKGFIFTGRGPYFPIALEGALKIKEIAYVHAEGYAAGELKHGPIALIDEEMVNIAILGSELFEKTLSNMEEVRARKGIIFAIAPKEFSEVRPRLGNHDFYFPLEYGKEVDLNPLYVSTLMQLFSYYVAKMRGTDIDKPRNLAKSVTVE